VVPKERYHFYNWEKLSRGTAIILVDKYNWDKLNEKFSKVEKSWAALGFETYRECLDESVEKILEQGNLDKDNFFQFFQYL